VIINELEKASEIIARLVEEGERQAEIERRKWEVQKEQWRREEAERLAAKALKESREELLQIIKAWGEATRIDIFFKDAEKRAASLSDDKKLKMLERLRLAREMIGSVDALDHFLAWRSPAER
jgi:GTP1/Obg family GTP-binding protein